MRLPFTCCCVVWLLCYMLCSGMMGWLTAMMDTTSWTSEQHAIAKDEFQLYKKKLRPLIRNADHSCDRRVTGELLTTGLKVTLPNPQSSDLVFFEERK